MHGGSLRYSSCSKRDIDILLADIDEHDAYTTPAKADGNHSYRLQLWLLGPQSTWALSRCYHFLLYSEDWKPKQPDLVDNHEPTHLYGFQVKWSSGSIYPPYMSASHLQNAKHTTPGIR